jgi:hypothetical protein
MEFIWVGLYDESNQLTEQLQQPWQQNGNLLFLKHEINSQHEEYETDSVIQPKGFILKKKERKNNKHRKRDHFLYHFQLNE